MARGWFSKAGVEVVKARCMRRSWTICCEIDHRRMVPTQATNNGRVLCPALNAILTLKSISILAGMRLDLVSLTTYAQIVVLQCLRNTFQF